MKDCLMGREAFQEFLRRYHKDFHVFDVAGMDCVQLPDDNDYYVPPDSRWPFALGLRAGIELARWMEEHDYED